MSNALKIKQDWEKAVGQRFKGLVADMGMDMKEFAETFWKILKFPTKKAALRALYDREKPDIYYAVRFAVEFGIDLEYALCQSDEFENSIIPHGRYADKTNLQAKVTPSASRQ